MVKKLKRPFEVQYFFWGHTRSKKADAKGFIGDPKRIKEALEEAYANAARHLGRGSVYYRAIIIDREQERIVDILTRDRHGIHFREGL